MPDKKKQSQAVDAGPSQSLLSKMFTPLTDAPSRMMSDFNSQVLDRRPTENALLARIKGFGAGALQGAGDLMSDMTSPASLATMAVPAIASMRHAGSAIRPAVAEAIAKPDIPTIDVTPQFNNADEAMQYYWNQLARKRGLPEDIPSNPVAQTLESERKVIERRFGQRRTKPTRSFKDSAGRREGDKPNVAERMKQKRQQLDREAMRKKPMTREEGDKKIDDLQAQFRRSQMKRVK